MLEADSSRRPAIRCRVVLRTPPQKHGQPYLAAFELAFVEELAPVKVDVANAAARSLAGVNTAAARGSS